MTNSRPPSLFGTPVAYALVSGAKGLSSWEQALRARGWDGTFYNLARAHSTWVPRPAKWVPSIDFVYNGEEWVRQYPAVEPRPFCIMLFNNKKYYVGCSAPCPKLSEGLVRLYLSDKATIDILPVDS